MADSFLESGKVGSSISEAGIVGPSFSGNSFAEVGKVRAPPGFKAIEMDNAPFSNQVCNSVFI